MEKENESKTTEVVKKKKKLTKIQITRIIMASISAICLIFAIIFTFIKTPIDGSIYCINTTLEEREETWDKKYKEMFDLYDRTYSASHYENRMTTSNFAKFLYKESYAAISNTENQLTLEVINFTDKNLKILGAVYIENREDDSIYIRIDESEDNFFSSKSKATYVVTVDADFEMDDYVIWARGVDDDGDNHSDWTYLQVTSYEKELERTKVFSIIGDIEKEIGEKPTSQNESKEPIPRYMVEILDARLRFILFYIFSVVFLVLAITIHKPKYTHRRLFAILTEPEFVEPEPEIIIKEIHHAPKIKKVTCLHCGSRYKDNLDECPNCGSAKIEKEPDSKE
ncbi:MAG: hypothetical protein E7341_03635 [Clostridiales bacterium]|nr:hypothetical protein [Clostridiales bacterium]